MQRYCICWYCLHFLYLWKVLALYFWTWWLIFRVHSILQMDSLMISNYLWVVLVLKRWCIAKSIMKQFGSIIFVVKCKKFLFIVSILFSWRYQSSNYWQLLHFSFKMILDQVRLIVCLFVYEFISNCFVSFYGQFII